MRTTWITLLTAAVAMAAEPATEIKNDAAPAKEATDVAKEAARETAIEHLFGEHEATESLAQAVEQARKAGVSTQSILEARFLHFVDADDDDAVAALLPEMLAAKNTFKPEQSQVFATTDDWLAATEYVQALAALKSGDKDGFKQHIKEAFWLSPSQGSAFAPHVERIRMDEAMRAVKFDFERELQPIEGKDAMKFSKIKGERKALLLHFWSPIILESQDLLPEYVKAARDFESHGIATATIVDSEGEVISRAKEAYKKLVDKPGAWLIDSKEHSLERELRAQNAPTFVLLNADGSVLYHGNFSEDAFWNELRKISPGLKQPEEGSPADHVDGGE